MHLNFIALLVKNLPANAGDIRDLGSTPGSRRSPGGGHDNQLWYSCLENLLDRGAWRATVHSVVKSRTRLRQISTHTQIYGVNFLCSFVYRMPINTVKLLIKQFDLLFALNWYDAFVFCSVSQLHLTLCTIIHKAPLSMEIFRQEYWSGSPFLSPGHLHNPEIEPHVSCVSCFQAISLLAELFHQGSPWWLYYIL